MSDKQSNKISPVQERIREFIEYLGITVKDFEKSVGKQNGFVSKIGFSLHKKSLEAIQKKYPNLNTDWLIAGVGSMLVKSEMDSSDVSNQNLTNKNYQDLLIAHLEKELNNRDKLIEQICSDKDKIIERTEEALELWKKKAKEYEKKISANPSVHGTKIQPRSKLDQGA